MGTGQKLSDSRADKGVGDFIFARAKGGNDKFYQIPVLVPGNFWPVPLYESIKLFIVS